MTGPQESSLTYAPDAPIVVLSPHFDDAVLGCWTLLGPGEEEIVVVNVFAGRPNGRMPGEWDRATLLRRRHRRILDRIGLGSTTSLRHHGAWHVERRAAEDARALEALGRAHVDLDLLDVQYREAPGSTSSTPTSSAILGALVERLPAASALLLPAALGATDVAAPPHVDHVLVRSVLEELSGFGGRVRLYADVPYACRLGWPDWVAGSSGSSAATRAWRQSFDDAGLAIDSLVPEVRVLTADDRRRKRSALQAYRTQWPAFRRLEDELAFEVFWQVSGTVRGR